MLAAASQRQCLTTQMRLRHAVAIFASPEIRAEIGSRHSWPWVQFPRRVDVVGMYEGTKRAVSVTYLCAVVGKTGSFVFDLIAIGPVAPATCTFDPALFLQRFASVCVARSSGYSLGRVLNAFLLVNSYCRSELAATTSRTHLGRRCSVLIEAAELHSTSALCLAGSRCGCCVRVCLLNIVLGVFSLQVVVPTNDGCRRSFATTSHGFACVNEPPE